MPRQPEGKIVKKIQDLVTEQGGLSLKIQGSDESFQRVGIPDLLICHRGFFIGAEVKQPGAELRPAQRVVLHEIFEAGGHAAVLETVKQAERLLADIEEGGCNQPACYYIRGRYYFKRPSTDVMY